MTRLASSAADAKHPEFWNILEGAWSPCLHPRGGSIVRDSSGKKRNGSTGGIDPATDWILFRGYPALDLDGSDDYAYLGDTNVSPEKTVAFWYQKNYTTSNTERLCSRGASSEYCWTCYTAGTSGEVFIIMYGSTGGEYITWRSYAHLGGLSLNNRPDWTHIAITMRNSPARLQFFFNGQFHAQETTSSGAWNYDSPDGTEIGRLGNGTEYCNMRFGEFLSWGRILNADEIQLLHGLGPGQWRASKKRLRNSNQIVVTPTSHLRAPRRRTIAKSPAEAEYPHLLQNMVGAWSPRLHPRGGSILRDMSANANHGTLTSMDPATDWVVEKGHRALDFDGSSDYVTIPDSPKLDFTTSMGVSFWFRATAAAALYDNLFGKTTSDNWNDGFGCWFETSLNNIEFWINAFNGTGKALVSFNSSTNRGLNHLVCIADSEAVSVYLNGVKGTDGTAATITTTATPLLLGTNTVATSYNSPIQIFDAVFYSKLSRNLVPELYKLGPGGWATPRRRRATSAGEFPAPTFQSAWARGSNALVTPGIF